MEFFVKKNTRVYRAIRYCRVLWSPTVHDNKRFLYLQLWLLIYFLVNTSINQLWSMLMCSSFCILNTIFYEVDLEIINNPQICRILAYQPAEKSRQEFCKFLGYLKFPHQPYKKWSLDDFYLTLMLKCLDRKFSFL